MKLALTALLFSSLALAQTRQVAITIDDLPRGGDTRTPQTHASLLSLTAALMRSLDGVPATGFVNSCRVPSLPPGALTEILRLWLDAGKTLGNHTASHPSLNNVSPDEYIADVVAGEAAIERATGRRPDTFRHPFLHAGKTEADRSAVERALTQRGYRIAPVTLDNSDWLFAAVYTAAAPEDRPRIRAAYVEYMDSIFAFFEDRALAVVGRPIPHILLIHASQLNADALPDLLAMMRRRGYSVVTLDQALRDPAYRLPDAYYGPGGISWIHRWAITKGMEHTPEPAEPTWIGEAFKRRASR